MQSKHEGREVERVWWDDDGNSALTAQPGRKLVLRNEYHGEYDLDWICEEADGVELSRYNVKTIGGLIWKKQESLDAH